VRSAAGIAKPEDFHGKKIATPQIGNTQDVALRAWLQAHSLKTRDKGGDVLVIPIANPDNSRFFSKEKSMPLGRRNPGLRASSRRPTPASSWMSATSGPIANS